MAQRESEGWRLAAIEWERELSGDPPELQDPPFGLRVAADGYHLEPEPAEQAVLVVALENIVQDRGYIQAAGELNRLGYRTRSGSHWTAVSVFELLPRMIEAGPAIFSTDEWHWRRRSASTASGAD
jgi:hypothetical protein